MNRFQIVKIIVLFVLSGWVNHMNAQIKMIKEQPLTFDGQTFSELLDKGQVNEMIRFYNIQAYTEVEKDSIHLEKYIRINDTIYYYQHFENKNILDEGHFEINLDSIIKADTSEVWSYGVYESTIVHNHYFEPVKRNKWQITNANGEIETGEYEKGERTGIWKKRVLNKHVKTIKYLKGDTIGIYKPSHKQILKYSNFLIDEDLCICSKFAVKNEMLTVYKKRTFEKCNKLKCNDRIEFDFNIDGTVELKHLKVESDYLSDYTGSYKYEILDTNELIIYLKGSDKIALNIEYWGKDEIIGTAANM